MRSSKNDYVISMARTTMISAGKMTIDRSALPFVAHTVTDSHNDQGELAYGG